MADRAKKISELPTASGAVGSDYMLLVANTAGTANTKKISFSNVATSVLNSVVAPAGQVFFSSGNSFTSNTSLTFTANGLVAVSNVTVGTEGSGDAVLHVHGAIASNLVPDTPNNYFLGSDSHPWGTLWASTIRTANISYGDQNIVIQMAGSQNSYIQSVIQNLSNGENSSTNYNVSADNADSENNYGEFGINSSGFSGPGRFSDPLAVYVAAATSNLVVGTYSNYPVNISVNGATDWEFGTDGKLKLPDGGDVVYANGGSALGGSTGDIRFQGTWIRNKDTGDIYISPQDGNTWLYIPSNDNANTGSPVTLAAVGSNGHVQIQTGTSFYTWDFSANGILQVPGAITGPGGMGGNLLLQAPVNNAALVSNFGAYNTVVVSDTDVHITTSPDSGTTTNTWTFGNDSTLRLPNGTVIGSVEGGGTTGISGPSNAYLLFETKASHVNGVSSVVGSSGMWESNPQTNLATTGGSGYGLTVNITESGGYIGGVAVVNTGINYANGDTISVVSGSSSGSFVVTVSDTTTISAFNPDGSLELGGPISYLYLGVSPLTGSGDPAYPTAIDLSKTVHKLGDNNGSYYTLADGTEGQVIYFVRKHVVTDISYGNIHILVANAYYGINQLTNQNLYFGSGQDLITLVFTDGAWQQNGGTWD